MKMVMVVVVVVVPSEEDDLNGFLKILKRKMNPPFATNADCNFVQEIGMVMS